MSQLADQFNLILDNLNKLNSSNEQLAELYCRLVANCRAIDVAEKSGTKIDLAQVEKDIRGIIKHKKLHLSQFNQAYIELDQVESHLIANEDDRQKLKAFYEAFITLSSSYQSILMLIQQLHRHLHNNSPTYRQLSKDSILTSDGKMPKCVTFTLPTEKDVRTIERYITSVPVLK